MNNDYRFDVSALWNHVHHGRHVAEGCEFDMATRSWLILCSCGRLGMVNEGAGYIFIERDRLHMCTILNAMTAMSNVMACVVDAFEHRRGLMVTMDHIQHERIRGKWQGDYGARMSEEWSAEVRRKVAEREEAARLKVYCQTEED